MPVPEDGSSNKRIYYTPNNSVKVETGDSLRFTKNYVTCTVVTEGEDADGIQYFTCGSTNKNGNYHADTIAGMPNCLFWCRGWEQDYVGQVNAQLGEAGIDRYIRTEYTESSDSFMFENSNFYDKYTIESAVKVKSSDVENIFADLMGDPTVDEDVPRSIRQTTFWGCFTREAESRELIDLDSLGTLANSAGLDNVFYSIDLEDDNTGEFDILKMLHNVCITIGAKMVWKYSETKRSWFLTFKPMFGESIASGVISGRTLDGDVVILHNDCRVPDQRWRQGHV
jgi:hypothetical protein